MKTSFYNNKHFWRSESNLNENKSSRMHGPRATSISGNEQYMNFSNNIAPEILKIIFEPSLKTNAE